jgi:hypothetical protein
MKLQIDYKVCDVVAIRVHGKLGKNTVPNFFNILSFFIDLLAGALHFN